MLSQHNTKGTIQSKKHKIIGIWSQLSHLQKQHCAFSIEKTCLLTACTTPIEMCSADPCYQMCQRFRKPRQINGNVFMGSCSFLNFLQGITVLQASRLGNVWDHHIGKGVQRAQNASLHKLLEEPSKRLLLC